MAVGLVVLVAAGCGGSQPAHTEAGFRYPTGGLVPVADPATTGRATSPRPPGGPGAPTATQAPSTRNSSQPPSAQAVQSGAQGASTAASAQAAQRLQSAPAATLAPGTSEVAWAAGRPVPVYPSPAAARPERRFPAVDSFGVTQVFLVRRATPGWLEVYLPTRPNGSTGWVRSASVTLKLDRYRVVVDLARHELTTMRAGQPVMHTVVGIGKPATPTPRGMFYIVEKLRMIPATGPYGTYAFGLSAHSTVLRTFGTGDAQVALHGTNEPASIGRNWSNGCVHLRDGVADWLARTLPLGTPVQII